MVAGTAVGPGEGTELLGRIVGGGMDPDHLAVDGELDGGADDGHLDPAVAVRAADPVHGPGEAHIARVVGDASDRHASRGETGLAGGRCGGSWLLLLGLAGPEALGVRGDKHALVGDLDDAVGAEDLDELAGQPLADVVLEAADRDLAGGVDPAPDAEASPRPELLARSWAREG